MRTIDEILMNKGQKFANSFEKLRTTYEYLGLKFNFRSLSYIRNTAGITLTNIRTGYVYENGNLIVDIDYVTLQLVVAGLVGSEQATEEEALDKAYELCDKWLKHDSLHTLWYLIVLQMEEKHHFFVTAPCLEMLNSQSQKTNKLKDIIQVMMGANARNTILMMKSIGLSRLQKKSDLLKKMQKH